MIFLFIILQICLAQTKYEIIAEKQIVSSSEFFANSVIGVIEATGKNDGSIIEQMQKVGGGYKGLPYCYYYQYWCFWKAKQELDSECKKYIIPIPKSGSSQAPYTYALANGKKVKYEARKHDLIIWKSAKNWTGHIERVKEVLNNGWVETYAGNTSNGLSGDQREGNGIFLRKRNIKHPLSRILLIRGLVGYESKL